MAQIRNNHPDVQKAIDVITEYPQGITSLNVSIILKMGEDRTSRLLTLGKALGKLNSLVPLWVTTENFPGLELIFKERHRVSKQKSQERNRKNYKTKALLLAISNNTTKKPLPKKFMTYAPNSVFQLAEFMEIELV